MSTILARTFWPTLWTGIALAVAWRFVRPGRLRTSLQIAASLLVLVPQALILFLLYQSIALLLYQEALLSLWMLGIAALLMGQLWKRWSGREENPSAWNRVSQWRQTEQEIAFEKKVYSALRERQQKRGPVVLILIALVMGGFGLYLARSFVTDAFFSRIVVEGRVERLKYNRGSRAPRLSDIVINGQMFHATRDLHSQLRPGDYIRAEIGAGSHAILRWERLY